MHTGNKQRSVDDATPPAPVWLPWLERWYMYHRAFAVVVFVLVASLAWSTGAVSTNVTAVVGLILLTSVLGHKFTIRALKADDDWATDRARKLAARSYERGNIDGVMEDYGRTPLWRVPRNPARPKPVKHIANKS